MSKASISYQKIQYENYGNWYLKAYTPDTNNAVIIYSSTTDENGFDKVLLDNEGFTPFIPHIDGYFDLWLFSTVDEADENITTNAIKLASNITAQSLLDNVVTADYENVGTTQILSSSKVNQTYDQIEAGGIVDLPPIYHVPNFISNQTQITRELSRLGIDAGGGLQIGDALVTNRDLDSNPNFIAEGSYFDRLDYPEFDGVLGEYIPFNTNFSTASLSQNYIDSSEISSISSSNESSYSVRAFGELNDDKLYYIRYNFLYIVNKSDMNIDHKISAPTGLGFSDALINTANELIILCLDISTNTNNNEIHLYKLLSDNTISNVFSSNFLNGNGNVTNQYDSIKLIQNSDTNDYYVISPLLFNSSGYSFSTFVCSLFYIKSDFLESSLSTINRALGTTNDGLDKPYIFYYNTNNQTIDMIFDNRSGNTDRTFKILRLSESLLNKSNATLLNITIVEDFFLNFGSLPLNVYTSTANGLEYDLGNTNSLPKFFFDKKQNTLLLHCDFFQTDSGTILTSEPKIQFIQYNMNDLSVNKSYNDSVLKIKDFDLYNSSGSGIGKVESYKTVTIQNKEFNICFRFDSDTSSNKICFINFDDNFDLNVLDSALSYAITDGSGSVSVNEISDLNRKYIIDSNKDIYFLISGSGSSSDNSVFAIQKLDLDDGVITDLKRPAPAISALGSSKGFWKAL